MAHEIDTTVNKNGAAFFAGKPAWHGLGTVVAEAQTSAEAIKLAGLDWQVLPQQMFTRVGGLQGSGDWVQVPGLVNVRSDSGAALGVVGEGYSIFQNSEGFDFLDEIVQEKLAMFETAGSLKGGRRVWLLAALPAEIKVTSSDVVRPYLLLTNTHDGSGCLRVLPTSVRVVCNNTLTLALGDRHNSSKGVTIRHTKSLKDRVAQAKKALGIINERIAKFSEEAALLASVRVTESQVRDYARGVFGLRQPKQAAAPAGDGASALDGAAILDQIVRGHEAGQDAVQELLQGDKDYTERMQRRDAKLLDTIIENWHNERNSLPGIGGTAWAAFNAVTEYVDHGRSTRGRDDRDRADNRMESVLWGSGDDIKQEALAAALQLAK